MLLCNHIACKETSHLCVIISYILYVCLQGNFTPLCNYILYVLLKLLFVLPCNHIDHNKTLNLHVLFLYVSISLPFFLPCNHIGYKEI